MVDLQPAAALTMGLLLVATLGIAIAPAQEVHPDEQLCLLSTHDTVGTLSNNRCNARVTDYGEAQVLNGQEMVERFQEHILQMDRYMRDIVFVEDQYANVSDVCLNRNPSCVEWSLLGACDDNPGFMKIHCAPACFSCEMLEYRNRCSFDRDAPCWWDQNDFHRVFDRIVHDAAYDQYDRVVLRQPKEDEKGQLKDGPWLVMLDNFLSEEECQDLIDIGNSQGFRWYDPNVTNVHDVHYTIAHSECYNALCAEHPTVQRVHKRLLDLTGIPEQYLDQPVLGRYENGESFGTHNDYIDSWLDLPHGPIVLTLLIYLSDVSIGGETFFPVLNATVGPKRGRLVLWPSVSGMNPTESNTVYLHESLPIRNGIKYTHFTR